MDTSKQGDKRDLNLKELLRSSEIQKQMKDWKEDSWEEFNILNVESELPRHEGINHDASMRREVSESDTIVDIPPVLYGKLKGVHAKVLVDQGAKVTVISQKFAEANGVGWSRLHTPVKLSMANGVVEPVFHKSQLLSLVVGEFKHKMTAFVAPIKNYDLILGRDNLIKLHASGSVELYDKRAGKRIELLFGKKHEEKEPDMQNYISTEQLEKMLEKDKDIMVFEISVEQEKEKENSITENKEEKDHEKELRLKEEFKHIMKDELPDKLPPERGLNHYIDLQGRIPRTAPRGCQKQNKNF